VREGFKGFSSSVLFAKTPACVPVPGPVAAELERCAGARREADEPEQDQGGGSGAGRGSAGDQPHPASQHAVVAPETALVAAWDRTCRVPNAATQMAKGAAHGGRTGASTQCGPAGRPCARLPHGFLSRRSMCRPSLLAGGEACRRPELGRLADRQPAGAGRRERERRGAAAQHLVRGEPARGDHEQHAVAAVQPVPGVQGGARAPPRPRVPPFPGPAASMHPCASAAVTASAAA